MDPARAPRSVRLAETDFREAFRVGLTLVRRTLVLRLALCALLGLRRSGIHRVWRPGTRVGAEVRGDELVLGVPFHPHTVRLHRIRRLRVREDVVTLRWDPIRRWQLLRELFSDADLQVLRQASSTLP